MIEASAKVSERTLNAEVAARLQWSFDAGYNANAETEAVQRSALATIQSSPVIRMEKLLIAAEERLESRLEELERRVAAIEDSSGH